MFRSAVAVYQDLFCSFGGGSAETDARIHAMSCLVSPRHVITVAHVLRDIAKTYSWPVVSKFDGLFRCETAFISDEDDIAVMQTTDLIAPHQYQLRPPQAYPEVSPKDVAWGMRVGYLSRLRKPESSGRNDSMYFSSADVAYRGESEEGHARWVFSSGFSEPGFSGSPVFLADGSLVGVLAGTTAMFQEPPDYGEAIPPIPWALPHIATIPQISKELLREIAESVRMTGARTIPPL